VKFCSATGRSLCFWRTLYKHTLHSNLTGERKVPLVYKNINYPRSRFSWHVVSHTWVTVSATEIIMLLQKHQILTHYTKYHVMPASVHFFLLRSRNHNQYWCIYAAPYEFLCVYRLSQSTVNFRNLGRVIPAFANYPSSFRNS